MSKSKKVKNIETADAMDEQKPTNLPPLKGGVVYQDSRIKFEKSISVLIRFEETDYIRGRHLCNKRLETFTKIVNDALKEYLTKHEQ